MKPRDPAENCEIEITPKMIGAGERVLEVRWLELTEAHDEGLFGIVVGEILLAALQSRQ